jgi:hypothetical protein
MYDLKQGSCLHTDRRTSEQIDVFLPIVRLKEHSLPNFRRPAGRRWEAPSPSLNRGVVSDYVLALIRNLILSASTAGHLINASSRTERLLSFIVFAQGQLGVSSRITLPVISLRQIICSVYFLMIASSPSHG